MAASITVSGLTWSVAGHPPLFSDLSLKFTTARTGLVGRNGVGKSTLLRLIAGELSPQAGGVAVRGRLGRLRQTVQVAADETVADLFGAGSSLALLRKAERGEATDAELGMADWTLETRIAAALGRMGLKTSPDTPLARLSGGQRTRAALAALVCAEPDYLLLDEPTNNLDRDGRQAVIELLASWRSGAIVVSHDRELLETMDEIVELTTLGATRYGGNWSVYRGLKAQELAAVRRNLADAEKRVAEVDRSAQKGVERQARRTGTADRKAADGGIPKILLGRRKDQGEKTAGENTRLAERRREQAVEEATAARERIEVLQPFKVELPPTRLPSGKLILSLEDVTAGHVPGQPILEHLSFRMTGPERVAVSGPNGSGKTTLLSLITGAVACWSGRVQTMTGFALLDQAVSLLDPTVSIRENFRRRHAGLDENACRAALARFRFRADAAHQVVGTLSGGQLLRAGLVCVLGGDILPPLLILDEPTNHLDIDSIEAVEAGLRAFDGALLVVSHDEVFLEAIGITRRLVLSPRTVKQA
jgi:ATPase subunit of ABC transporter with duplicated ATPase domains